MLQHISRLRATFPPFLLPLIIESLLKKTIDTLQTETVQSPPLLNNRQHAVMRVNLIVNK